MKYVTIDEVYAIHEKMIEIGGGRREVHDFTLLHSAVERPKAHFGGEELYPNLFIKAATLIHSLIRNHSFDDGNKRTAYYSIKRFFYINGYDVVADTSEVIAFTKAIDVQKIPLSQIEQWLKQHAKKKSI